MATCAVSGNITGIDGVALQSVTVEARINAPVLSGTTLLIPALSEVATDASGNFTLTLQQSISVIFTVMYPPIGTEPQLIYQYTGTIPASTTASFSSVITVE